MKNYPRSPYSSPQRGHFLLRMRRAGVQPDRDIQVSAEVSYQAFKKDLSGKLQALLTEAQRSSLSRERFTVWVKGLLKDAYQQAFDLGLKAAGWTGKMEDADHLWLGSFANEEEQYLNQFISDVYEGKGRMPKEQRLQMYADALDIVFTAGKLAATPPGATIKWVINESEHCKDCIRLAMGSPYTKETLPTQPGVDVICLSNCKCHLEFEEPHVTRPAGFPVGQLPSSFPLRVTPPIKLSLPHLKGVKLRIDELQMMPPEQLVKLQRETQQQIASTPFPSRAYNLQVLALLGILLAFSRKDEQDDVALTQRYRDAGVLPLGDLYRPSELWTVQPVPGGWSARSSGRVLGVFEDKGEAYEMLIAVAKKQGRTVPGSLQTPLQRSFGGFPLLVKSRKVSAYDRTDPHTGKIVHVGEHMDRRNSAKEKKMFTRTKLLSVDEIKRIVDNSEHRIFVRWSQQPAHDLKPGATSRDYVSGEQHTGLSAVEIPKDSTPAQIASHLAEYGFLRMKGDVKPHLYIGENVGKDSDGHELIRPIQYVGSVSPDVSILRDRLILDEKEADLLERLPKASAQDILTSSLVKIVKQKAEKKLAIAVDSIDKYEIALPEGYVRNGEWYVFEPTRSSV